MKKNMSLFLVLCMVFSPAFAYGELSIQDLRLPASFHPGPSPVATIESIDEEPGVPGFLIFSVQGPQGHYKAHGLSKLRQGLNEIDVLDKINREEDTGGGLAAGAADSLKGTGRGLKNLVLHPVDSAKGIGRGVGKLGDKVGDAFREKEEGEKTTASEGFLGSTKRELAKQLGVDVYSRNPELQGKLNQMAKARMGGKGVVMVASFFLPVGLLASAVLTVSGVNDAADQLVNDNDRTDLYKLNEKALLSLGCSKEKVIRFLNHSYYTPRELTYIRFYLEKLRGAKGFENILDAAIEVQTEVPADKLLHEAQIAADAVTEAFPAMELVMTPEGILLVKGDRVLLASAYDYLDAPALVQRAGKRLLFYKEKFQKKTMEIRNGGAISPQAGGALVLKGIQTRRMCLFEVVPGDPPAV